MSTSKLPVHPRRMLAVVENYAALRAFAYPGGDRFARTAVMVLGHTSAGDGGGGTFIWVAKLRAAQPQTEDGGVVIASDSRQGAWERVYSGPVDVRWFGAVGDGSDSRAVANMHAIQGAINYCTNHGGGTVLIPAGEFRIAPRTRTEDGDERYLELKSRVDIVGVGSASLLKVIDNAGPFRAIFTSAVKSNESDDAVEDIRFASFRIDTNSENNEEPQFDRSAADFEAHQICLAVYRFRNIALNDMWFDYGGTNALMINNVSKVGIDSEIHVQNCRFVFHKLKGAKGRVTDHYDNTAAYLKGRNIIAVNNRFLASSIEGVYAFGALEIHGGDAVATGNVSTNFAVCVAVVGDKDWTDVSNISVTGNVANNANFPFMVNPFAAEADNTEHFPTGLVNVNISNNVAHVCQKRWGRFFWGGIGYNSGAGYLRNITISGNTLSFEPEDNTARTISDPLSGASVIQWEDTAAIAFKPQVGSGANLVEGLNISNNAVYQCSCTGIAVGKSSKTRVLGVNINGNSILNSGWCPCGRAEDDAGEGCHSEQDWHRAAIRLYGDFHGCSVIGNTIVDTAPDVFRGCYWLWARGTFKGPLSIASNSIAIYAAIGAYKQLLPDANIQ